MGLKARSKRRLREVQVLKKGHLYLMKDNMFIEP